MKLATIKLSPEVQDVLRRSVVNAAGVKLPEQLDRPLYMATDKALKAIGGKWNRGRGLHVFAADPRETIAAALDSGSVLDKKKTFQAFYTPDAVADHLVELAELTSGDRVLEPSAGNGAIVRALVRAGNSAITAVEVDDERSGALAAAGAVAIYTYDFLLLQPELFEFDAVIMNPPFTQLQDVKHVLHAWEFTTRVLVAIVSKGFLFREDKLSREFRRLNERHGVIQETLPAGTFHESGTEVETTIVVWRK